MTAPPGPPVGFLLSAVGFATAARFRALLEPFGLDPREFNVLRAVAIEAGVSQQGCGERLGVRPNAMVGIVDSLEERGLVERRSYPGDRRARALHVTPAGLKALESATKVVAADSENVLKGLTEKQRQQLIASLVQIRGNLGLEPGVHPGMSMSTPPYGH